MSESLRIAAAEVIGLKRECLRLATDCRACGERFEFWQGTLCGLVFGQQSCPHCQALHHLDTEVAVASLEASMKASGADAAIAANASLTRLAESWHQMAPWKDALQFEGLDLGPPLEREISHHLTAHLNLKHEGLSG